MTVSPSDLATILAALRYFQDEFQTTQPAELMALFPQFDMAPPISTADIDALCERLNTAEEDQDDNLCDCEAAGFFCAGVPGVLAHLENGLLALGAKVERCDQCQRLESDEAALARLQQLGIAD